ncbi:hypothetical protein [Arthrobacter sp. zg-Y1110]|uniref:hypothetical protein n=1 Tax=Arthrobacter sp. zg-Y1110 TaxID=2886932 RepID=UPI001D159542|nr:hypothetical protein [Arthrobacter sp. zg-Y1110]MCC3292509.1 hypothetical protein [Arthrobacter sp. zg-Y1110]UWX87059.1 hypothetical protein N2K99_17050 [Arthrobacter sp. zg-Y1110]
MNTKPMLLAAAAAVLSLSACGPPEDGGEYASLDELKSAYQEAGMDCGDWKVSEVLPPRATAAGTCSDNVTLSLYEREIDASIAAVSGGPGDGRTGLDRGGIAVHGVNWAVTGGNVEKLAEKTGGRLIYRSIPVPSLPGSDVSDVARKG